MSRTITNINIESYSDKAIVVRGNTKSHKEALMNLGGKYNDRLKGGEGWIFPKIKQKDIENWMRTGIITDNIRNNFNAKNNTTYQPLQIEILKKRIERIEKLYMKLLELLEINIDDIEEEEEKEEEEKEEEKEEEEEDEKPRRRLLR